MGMDMKGLEVPTLWKRDEQNMNHNEFWWRGGGEGG